MISPLSKMTAASKKCFKCGETKELSAFYRHSRMADGHLNKCKECAKNDVKMHREDNLEIIRAYDRNRSRDHSSDRYQNKLVHSRKKSVIKARTAINKRNRLLFPNKTKARNKIRDDIKNGKIIRPNFCEYCGKICTPQAHHSSYEEDMFTAVTWLCASCHGEVHRLYD